tara:strand:- start:66 stop:746 length:681 start_codon:yes stop_codon:yes gene_type:complete
MFLWGSIWLFPYIFSVFYREGIRLFPVGVAVFNQKRKNKKLLNHFAIPNIVVYLQLTKTKYDMNNEKELEVLIKAHQEMLSSPEYKELLNKFTNNQIKDKLNVKTYSDLKTVGGVYINNESSITNSPDLLHATIYNRNTFPTEADAESSLALSQLLQVRKAYIGKWEADWNDRDQKKWCISRFRINLEVRQNWISYHEFSFPNEEMARDFMVNNQDLLKVYFKIVK